MRARFSVTYETVTDESAEHGDAAARGYVLESCTLREAIDELGCGHVEADCYPVTLHTAPRWFTCYHGIDYRTGNDESRALHVPDTITAASRLRLARLLRCYGVQS